MREDTNGRGASDRVASRRDRLDMLASVAVVLACAAVVSALGWQIVQGSRGAVAAAPPAPAAAARPERPLPEAPIFLDDAAGIGRTDAPVVLLMFSDFQCPFCQRFAADSFATLDREYFSTGRVSLSFRHLPLEAIHPQAFGAAVAAECARQQGRFWEMHDSLFRQDRGTLNEAVVLASAEDAGVEMTALRACATGVGPEAVRRDIEQAGHLGVIGTPGFIVGIRGDDGSMVPRRRLSGARPIEEFRATLDEVLSEASSAQKY